MKKIKLIKILHSSCSPCKNLHGYRHSRHFIIIQGVEIENSIALSGQYDVNGNKYAQLVASTTAKSVRSKRLVIVIVFLVIHNGCSDKTPRKV